MLSQNQKDRVKLKVESEGFASFWKSLKKNVLEANSPSRLSLIVELIDYAVSLDSPTYSTKPTFTNQLEKKKLDTNSENVEGDEPMRLFTMMNQKKD